MSDKILEKKVVDGVESLVNQLPNVTYGNHIMPHLNIIEYGQGANAFLEFSKDFQNINLSKLINDYGNLDNIDDIIKIKNLKKEISKLEKQKADLTSIFGEDGSAPEGALTHKMILLLQTEIEEYISNRDFFKDQSIEAENAYAKKLEEIDKNTKEVLAASSKKISDASEDASRKVKVIEQFSDFLSETNKNMNLYFWIILIVVIAVGFTIVFSVPDLLTSFSSYNAYVKKLDVKAGSLPIINYAFGILIVKLPWALCLSAVFTGMYSLLKGLLATYEKINQDKRNMSAIYSVTGNIAHALNEYGLSIVEEEEDPETEVTYRVIKKTQRELSSKRETLKWNQIINYFERMQTQQNVDPKDDKVEESKLKFATDLFNKVIDKFPAQK